MIYIFGSCTTNIWGYGPTLEDGFASVLEQELVRSGLWVATTWPYEREPLSLGEALAHVRIGAARLVAVGGEAVLADHRMFAALAESIVEERRRKAGAA